MVSSTKLKRFIRANADRIAFDYETLKDADKYKKNAAHYTYVPLADVADDVWRNTRIGDGGINNDENNHFADMDQPGGPGPYHGKTLLELCRSKANVDTQVWRDFYAGVGGNPGALPFRVWQMYKAMVDYLTDADGPDLVGFLCTAGCLAHYVGDACQPLHVSRLHHGYPHGTSVQKKVHSVYETDMLDVYAAEFVPMLRQRLAGVTAEPKDLDGKGAAIEVIELMRRTVRAIPPERIVDAYNGESGPAARRDRLWEDFGPKTADRMIDGARVLATLWESAWAAGGGDQIANADLVEIAVGDLSQLYRKKSFCPSVALDYIDEYL
jgi:hypothetical protein